MSTMRSMNRWLYRGGRPNPLAKVLNRLSAWMFRRPGSPGIVDTLEIVGRRSGRAIVFPVVITEVNGERYLVSMLGDGANWVRNLRAAGGAATLLKGGRREIRAEEVPVDQRAPILKRYCEIATSGRHHIPMDHRAPVSAFEPIAGEFPVFRIVDRLG